MFAAVSVEAVVRHKGVVNTRNAEFQVSMHWHKNYFVKIILVRSKKNSSPRTICLFLTVLCLGFCIPFAFIVIILMQYLCIIHQHICENRKKILIILYH